jgi:hypothetical protein
LEKCKKIVYLGHRRFLTTTHSVRKKGKHFWGVADHRPKPEVSWLSHDYDIVASGCIKGASTKKYPCTHC